MAYQKTQFVGQSEQAQAKAFLLREKAVRERVDSGVIKLTFWRFPDQSLWLETESSGEVQGDEENDYSLVLTNGIA